MLNQSGASATEVCGLQIIKASGEYFCAQCLLPFENDKEYKIHYKCELHMYNIKRRMLDLIPATPEQFELKKKQLIEQQKARKISEKSQKDKKAALPTQQVGNLEDYKCIPCSKSFATENTYQAHIISKKHKEQVKEYEAQSKKIKQDTPKVATITADKDQTVCLFCDFKSKDINLNMTHMNKAHSFFVSEEIYCIDLQGLLKHLGEKINGVQLCIMCENKGCKQFTTGDAVKKHMIDKGHCFMQSEVFDEYAEFYDFTPQIQQEIEYQKTLKNRNYLPEKEIEVVQNIKKGQEDDGEEWESDIDGEEDEEDDESDEKQNNKIEEVDEDEKEEDIQAEKTVKKQKKVIKKGKDEEWEDESEEEKETDGKKQKHSKTAKKYKVHRIKVLKARVNERGELELPNGKILGHRSLRHIYTQYYRPVNNYSSRMKAILGEKGFHDRQVVLATQNFQLKLMNKQKALEFHKQEKNLLATAMHRKQVGYVNIGLSHNKLQHHFRDSNPL